MAQAGRDIGREKETADHLTAGPGLVATKSQAKGATGGFALGAIGGAVAMAVFGGFARSQKTREESRVDV